VLRGYFLGGKISKSRYKNFGKAEKMDNFEKTVSKNYVYRGRIINVRSDEAELPNGKKCLREVVEHSGGASVIAADNNGDCYLVRQFRYPFGEEVLEIPAGKLNRGEAPEVCALRELKEETGLSAKNIVPLCKLYPTPGYSDEIIHVFLAREFEAGEQTLDEDEFLSLVKLSLSQAKRMVISGEIKDAKTAAAVLLADEIINARNAENR
jgi:ADP-ribose pyrophosphatase